MEKRKPQTLGQLVKSWNPTFRDDCTWRNLPLDVLAKALRDALDQDAMKETDKKRMSIEPDPNGRQHKNS